MDKYIQLRVVGKGTFGQAILVRSKEDNQQYIIKQINISSMSEKEKQEALNEVRVLSALNHPNIIRYITSFTSEGKLCIVMEYAEGGDLYQKIKNMKGVPFKEEVTSYELTSSRQSWNGSFKFAQLYDIFMIGKFCIVT